MEMVQDMVTRARPPAPATRGFFACALGRLALGTALMVGVLAGGALKGAALIEPLAQAAQVRP